MKNIFNPVYREDYSRGYSIGLNPYSRFDKYQYSEAFSSGFNFGRLDYERMNGLVSSGIPKLIVTTKILDDFLLAGMLGLEICSEGYTTFQLDIIEIWYRSGIEKYDPNQTIYLQSVLEEQGIEMNCTSE